MTYGFAAEIIGRMEVVALRAQLDSIRAGSPGGAMSDLGELYQQVISRSQP